MSESSSTPKTKVEGQMGAGRRLNAMEDEDELIEHKPINSARRDSKRTIPTISVRVIPLPLSLPLSLSPSLSPSLSLYISCYIVNTLPTYSGVGSGAAGAAMAAPLFGRSRPHPPIYCMLLSMLIASFAS